MSKVFSLVSVFCIILTFHPEVEGYAKGAPSEACKSLTPGHGVPPQTTKSPYSLVMRYNEVINRGETIILTLKGPATGFKGFMAQGRRSKSNDTTPQGTFWPATYIKSKTINCTSEYDTLTHSENGVKLFSTLQWTAPWTAGRYVVV